MDLEGRVIVSPNMNVDKSEMLMVRKNQRANTEKVKMNGKEL